MQRLKEGNRNLTNKINEMEKIVNVPCSLTEFDENTFENLVERVVVGEISENGITENYEYVILTNEIYHAWSGMKASEYKAFKGIRKESLRDNMTDIEVVLTDLGEIATKELASVHRPYGLEENEKIAELGGHAAKVAKEDIERNLGTSVISPKNKLKYQYKKDTLIK